MGNLFELFVAALLLAGATFTLLGSLGLAKLSDFYRRLHGPTKASTLGVGCLLVASSLYFSVRDPGVSVHEVLVTAFLFLTAPVSAHLLVRAFLAGQRAGSGEESRQESQQDG